MFFLLVSTTLVTLACMATAAVVPQPSGFGMMQYSGRSGAFTSHPGYLSYYYASGLKNRYVVTVPTGSFAQMTVDPTNRNYFAIRPYDFVVMFDGNLAGKLAVPCDVNSYTALGPSGVAYLSVTMAKTDTIRTFTSQSNVIVADFCVNSYSSGAVDPAMLGWQAFWASLASSPTNPQPAQTTAPVTTIPVTQAPASAKTCGKPSPKPSDIPNKLKIVNGVQVPDGAQPWACALVQTNGKAQFCDCTVIDKQWVVTAGHCVAESNEATMKANDKIYMGVTNLNKAVAPQNIFSISRVILHPQYDPDTTDFDVAMIKLATPIPAFSSTLMPACLPTAPITATAVKTGAFGRRICYVTGWGTLAAGERGNANIGSGSDLLLQAAIEMFNTTACKTYLSPYTFSNNMLCGGYDAGQFDSCQGDSGGPLVCDAGDGTWTLNGIVSWGLGCAEAKKPGVYSNVYALLPFITSTMAQN
ncbi:putative Transmembrane protease serine 9 [Hypsibius exemplaris]|uniref:Transmembrane protease serine 9 n=1 Tax=Hypsibius exemplaris TaxID=2072580 RepID=A0A9X6NQ62_HYPEX|nr:putative Transmembrane protease serine 9 [Hypsibius exemplaris]